MDASSSASCGLDQFDPGAKDNEIDPDRGEGGAESDPLTACRPPVALVTMGFNASLVTAFLRMDT